MSENDVGVNLKDKRKEKVEGLQSRSTTRIRDEESEEGIASSSTLLETATGTEGSEKMIKKPSQKPSHMTQRPFISPTWMLSRNQNWGNYFSFKEFESSGFLS
ncbi:hypothetical protein Acr_28g0008030 [Actinidia rufa]|uniref:Uncharacterized protein n=1 Tax=Actinidia rufa TaxID=165716 RepID=A0A7J0HAP9_9ERIC|nr:hypothetical protein Acr_28g0008030 [Actinidia rufa]